MVTCRCPAASSTCRYRAVVLQACTACSRTALLLVLPLRCPAAAPIIHGSACERTAIDVRTGTGRMSQSAFPSQLTNPCPQPPHPTAMFPNQPPQPPQEYYLPGAHAARMLHRVRRAERMMLSYERTGASDGSGLRCCLEGLAGVSRVLSLLVWAWAGTRCACRATHPSCAQQAAFCDPGSRSAHRAPSGPPDTVHRSHRTQHVKHDTNSHRTPPSHVL